jgi:hypothetical protein
MVLLDVNQVTELPVAKAEVIEVRQYATECPCCGEGQVAEPPAGLDMQRAFGARLEATVVYYRQEQHMSYVRTQAALQNLHGLEISQVRIPIGVVGIIYESRPNVTADAAGLCLKSGNAVILKGGSESFASNQVIAKLIGEATGTAGLPAAAVQLIPLNFVAVDAGYPNLGEVTDYIPEECFIDRRKFIDNEDLYEFLKAITKEEYEAYQDSAQEFLNSEAAQLFSAERFESIFLQIVQ